jgi:TonB family protein
VTYEMLTGAKPFQGQNITTVVYKIVNSPPVPPQEMNARLPSEYEHIFAKALAKEPENRFAEFSDFVSALNLEQFDRLEHGKTEDEPALGATEDEPTLVRLDEDQETVELPVPAAESRSSITERKPKGRALMMMRRQQKLIAAGAAVALAAFIGLSVLFAPDPLAEGVVIETDPVAADVFLNGALLGVSPIELPPMAFGEHDVRVEKEGFLPLEERFELIAGNAIEPLVFALQSARISLFLVSVPPGASVTIDGESSGQTPLEDIELEPGQHEIQVSRRGYNSWRRVLVARAGESVNLVARLRERAARTAKKASAASSAPAAPTATPEPEGSAGIVALKPNDTPAKHISGKAPGYPPMARKLKQQGRVTIEFVVTEEGVPTELVVVESAGAILDKAVLDALAKWRYEPAMRNNEPVRVKMRVRQRFRLGTR